MNNQDVEPKKEEQQDETKKGFEAIKSAGRAGAISLFLWEAAFWIIAGECVVLYSMKSFYVSFMRGVVCCHICAIQMFMTALQRCFMLIF